MRSPDIYDNIDAPVFVWDRVHSTGDLSWLLLKKKKPDEKLLKKLSEAWEKLYNEYLEEFGLSETFKSLKEKEIELALLKLEQVETGDRKLNTIIKILEIELNEMKASTGRAGFMDTKIAIESKFKFQINLHQTSIREFYSYLKHLN